MNEYANRIHTLLLKRLKTYHQPPRKYGTNILHQIQIYVAFADIENITKRPKHVDIWSAIPFSLPGNRYAHKTFPR